MHTAPETRRSCDVAPDVATAHNKYCIYIIIYIYVNSSTRRLRAAVLPLIPDQPVPWAAARRAAPRLGTSDGCMAARSHSGPVCRPSVGRSLHTRITITHRITSQIAHKYHTARSARFVRPCLGCVARNPPPRRRRRGRGLLTSHAGALPMQWERGMEHTIWAGVGRCAREFTRAHPPAHTHTRIHT